MFKTNIYRQRVHAVSLTLHLQFFTFSVSINADIKYVLIDWFCMRMEKKRSSVASGHNLFNEYGSNEK